MDITQEKLKVNCPHCNKKIILTYHTTSCPKCGVNFNPDDIKKTFHDYESALVNNKLYQFGDKMGKAGDSMHNAGDSMAKLGCSMTIFTIIVIVLLSLIF